MINSEAQTGTDHRRKLLDSLEIQNFRAFRSLKIERLGNVNLIVGKNSVGKSALLEALRLYAAQGAPDVILEILQQRDEWSRGRSTAREMNDVFVPIENLFYGRQQSDGNQGQVRIGPLGSTNRKLTLEIVWGTRKGNGSGESSWERVSSPTFDDYGPKEPRLAIKFGNEKSQLLSLEKSEFYRLRYAYNRLPSESSTFIGRSTYVSAAGLSIEEIVRKWEQISLTPAKDRIVQALQIISPAVENLDIIGRSQESPQQLTVKVKLANIQQPVSIRSLGEGMSRLFGLALAAVTAQDGMLLVDEIDSGLHYSVQVEAWRLIFATAERLNVQVFATTHSWDCVAAFQQVAAENKQQDGMLIRLEKKGDEIVPVLINEETLAIVTREQIEVR